MSATDTPRPIDRALAHWHEMVETRDPSGLGEFLHDDVVFHSPVVFTPVPGKALTAKYLEAAFVTFISGGEFRYTSETVDGDLAVLQFETTMNGKYVNGVDMIRVDADGRVIEFRVMIRPLQAVHAVHELMGNQLAADG
ncbi:MAG: nuclear transport factor 2 family protein [Acidimicrobiales bacterium]